MQDPQYAGADDRILGAAGGPQELADRMHGAWVRFVESGDPGWPEHPALEVLAAERGRGDADMSVSASGRADPRPRAARQLAGELPGDIRERARQSLLDWFAVTLGGCREDAPAALLAILPPGDPARPADGGRRRPRARG